MPYTEGGRFLQDIFGELEKLVKKNWELSEDYPGNWPLIKRVGEGCAVNAYINWDINKSWFRLILQIPFHKGFWSIRRLYFRFRWAYKPKIQLFRDDYKCNHEGAWKQWKWWRGY